MEPSVHRALPVVLALLSPPLAAAPLPSDALTPVFAMPEAARAALASRDHAAAATALAAIKASDVPGDALGDLYFLRAWSLVRAGKGADAAGLLDAVRKAEHVPPAYRDLVVGQVQAAAGDPVHAAITLQGVPPDARVWARARLDEAAARWDAGATAEAREIWEALAARPDPAEGSDEALVALALKAGSGSDASCKLMRRVWTAYPRSARGADVAREIAVCEARGTSWLPSRDQIAARADALQSADRFEDTIALLQPVMDRYTKADLASCRAWHAYGRALFKKNRLTEAVTTLTPAGAKCAGIDDEHGGRALYIAGKALERRKLWAEAGAAYEQIPTLYPAHSMADDGLVLAGIAWQEAGQPERARKLWAQLVASYPDGDLAAEGFWRLAWTQYLDGKTDAAIATAEQAIWQVPLDGDPVHALAARYWAARWRLYPDVAAPTVLTTDSARLEAGTRLLLDLCREHPTSYYALLAANRLRELAPEDLARVPRPAWPDTRGALVLSDAFAARAEVSTALQLARLGLVGEALGELALVPDDLYGPSEQALLARVTALRDPLAAHNQLHHYLLEHPVSLAQADGDALLRQAYPDLYWQELQTAAADYDWDPRVFHGLVREESSFNPEIVSWAGARGLSQLMPATAREVAKAMGRSVTNAQLFDPATNLLLGTRFFDGLVQRYNGSFYLSAAGYNAGPGNVGSWMTRYGNVPTDEFVERIPIRETRHYVKRVLGTYQTYHVLYDPGDLFSDWSATNHKAKPDG